MKLNKYYKIFVKAYCFRRSSFAVHHLETRPHTNLRKLNFPSTERMLVEFGKAGLIEKARQQPDKVRMVLDKIRSDGLMLTVEAVFNPQITQITRIKKMKNQRTYKIIGTA